ncbi:MAG TPA: hypothetical protein HA312_06390, partial [Candidatus Poseidonia sp.]|nr:hypothetical protein [Poseidonia sp.]
MAEVDPPVIDEADEVTSAKPEGFGFQLSESIIHAIDRQIVSSGLRLI